MGYSLWGRKASDTTEHAVSKGPERSAPSSLDDEGKEREPRESWRKIYQEFEPRIRPQ